MLGVLGGRYNLGENAFYTIEILRWEIGHVQTVDIPVDENTVLGHMAEVHICFRLVLISW